MIKLLIIAVSATVLFSATLYAQPSINDPVIFDHFEDLWGWIDTPDNNSLAAVLQVLNPLPNGFWHGNYFTFADVDGSVVLNGKQTDTIEENNDQYALIVEGNDSAHYLHAYLKTSASQDKYCYAGIGVYILTTRSNKEGFVDLTKLNAIKMKIKGDGYIVLKALTKDMDTLGFGMACYQTVINLPKNWQQVTIPAYSLKAPVNSVPYNLGWTWDGAAGGNNTGRREVKRFYFEISDHKDAELYIDDIEFDGMVYNDFIQQVSTKKHTHPSTKRPFSITENSIIYKTEKTEHVCLSVFSIRGEKIKEINEQKSAGLYKCNLAALHQNTLPAGMYIFQISIGLKKWQITHSLVNKTR